MNKTYVISDLHAHFSKLKDFLKNIDETDTVYFLGDAEDKGPEPIKSILLMAKDPRFKPLLGNHDYMMFRYISWRRREGIHDYEYLYELHKRKEQWIDWNFGLSTLKAFDRLKKDDKQVVRDYFEKAKLVYPNVQIGDRTFVLAHAYPYPMLFDGSKNLKEPLTMKDVDYWDPAINDYVWKRMEYPLWDAILLKGKTIITGHTMTRYIQSSLKRKHDEIYSDTGDLKTARYINVDCGLAADDEDSRLCALCLDDMSVKYY